MVNAGSPAAGAPLSLKALRYPLAFAGATVLLVAVAELLAQKDSRFIAAVTNAAIGVVAVYISLNVVTAAMAQRIVRSVAAAAVGAGLAVAAVVVADAVASPLLASLGVAAVALGARQWCSDAARPRQRGLLTLAAAAAVMVGVTVAAIEWANAEPLRSIVSAVFAAGDITLVALYASGRASSQTTEFSWRAVAGVVAVAGGVVAAWMALEGLSDPTRAAARDVVIGLGLALWVNVASAWRDSTAMRRVAAGLVVVSLDVGAAQMLAAAPAASIGPGIVAMAVGTAATIAWLRSRWIERSRWQQVTRLSATFLATIATNFAVAALAVLLPEAASEAATKLLIAFDIGVVMMVGSQWLPPRLAYIVRRLVLGAITIGIVALVVFFMLNLLPEKWWQHIVYAKNNTPARQAYLKHQLGVDQPPIVQFIAWLNGLLNWPPDLGYSGYYHDSVVDVISPHIMPTVILLGASYLLQLVIAVPVGIISAIKQYSKLDNTVMAGAFVGISMPNYWFGSMLIFFLAILPYQNGHGSIFPPGGECTLVGNMTPTQCWSMAPIPNQLWYLAMPAVVLAVQGIAGYARFVRGSMLDVLNQDFIRTARAKGLSKVRITLRHAFRNSLLPLITLIGIDLPTIFAGAVITEFVFNWPGMGQLSVNEVSNDDVTVVIGILLILSVLVVLGSLIADLFYTVADPRIKYSDSQ